MAKAEHCAGYRVYFVIVLLIPGSVKFNIVDPLAVFPLQLGFCKNRLAGGKTCVLQGFCLGLLRGKQPKGVGISNGSPAQGDGLGGLVPPLCP